MQCRLRGNVQTLHPAVAGSHAVKRGTLMVITNCKFTLTFLKRSVFRLVKASDRQGTLMQILLVVDLNIVLFASKTQLQILWAFKSRWLTNDCSHRHSSPESTCANSRYLSRLDNLLVKRLLHYTTCSAQLARSELDRMLDEVVVSGGLISQYVICGRSCIRPTSSLLASCALQVV